MILFFPLSLHFTALILQLPHFFYVSSVYDTNTGENLTRDIAGKWKRRTDAERTFSTAAAVAAPTEPGAGERFVAAVCRRVHALLFFTASGPTSLMRLKPGCWSGAPSSSFSDSNSNWGPADKEAPLRVLGDNVELKSLDAVNNPYLAAAALVKAGLTGVKNEEGGLPRPRGHGEGDGGDDNNDDDDGDARPLEEVVLRAFRSWKSPSLGIFSPEALDTLEALRLADRRAMEGWSYEETRERLSLLF